MDDMQPYNQTNKETWKALFAGEQTSLRDTYLNADFPFSVPCIVTTNNKNLFLNLMCEDEFKTQAYFVEVVDYLGPPGTRPLAFTEFKHNLSESTERSLEKKKKERVEFKLKATSDNFLNNFKSLLVIFNHTLN